MIGSRHLLLGALAGLLSFSSAAAQGSFSPKRVTQPQVIAGNGFATDIILLNSSTTTCEWVVVAHKGEGKIEKGVVVGGREGGVKAGLLRPHASVSVPIESPQGSFVGAVSVDNWLPECFNSFTVKTQFRAFGVDGMLFDRFSYQTQKPIKRGQCALAGARVDTDPSDGKVSVPGFAAVSVEPLDNSQLCHTLKNDRGQPITQEICQPTDGKHQAKLLTDIFTGGFESGDVSSWQVCHKGPASGDETKQIEPLFIDVVKEGGVTQYDANPHQIKKPGCTEDQFNACLDDRFKVSVDFRNTPSGPKQRAQIGGLLPDESGYFFFTDPNNYELVLKVFNGCPVNNHFWVFAAATTNVEYDIRVVDTVSGQSKTYSNPLGTPAPAITDTSAFATCP